MLCCVGLIGGLAVGQSIGGPWTVIAPAAGFAIGLAGDMKLMKGFHKTADPQPAPTVEAKPEVKSGSCCAAPSGQGRLRPWLIGAAAVAGIAIYAGWDWLEASGLSTVLILLVLVPFLLMCARGHGMKGKAKGDMTLADIRRTYEADSSEPPVRAKSER